MQCKRWRGYVSEPVIRDLYGVMEHEKAARTIVVTTAKFSKPTREWAKGKPILLYESDRIMAQLQKMQEQR